jgi:hypothetical protein
MDGLGHFGPSENPEVFKYYFAPVLKQAADR